MVDAMAEREAWREHFRKVCTGIGHVKADVWDTVPRVNTRCAWFGVGPTHKEVERALANPERPQRDLEG